MTAPMPEPRDDRRVVDRLPADLAEEVAEEMEATTGDDVDVRLGDPRDERSSLIEEQQSEYDGSIQGPPVSLAPIAPSQARGAIAGAVGFGAVGVVLGVIVGLIPMFDLAFWPRVGLWALVGLMAGSAAGFVFGGGREPELEGDTRDTSEDVVVAVESDAPGPRARALDLMKDAEVEATRRARQLAKEDHPRQPPEHDR